MLAKKGILRQQSFLFSFYLLYLVHGHYKCPLLKLLTIQYPSCFHELNHLHYETCAHTTLTMLLVNKTNKQKNKIIKTKRKGKETPSVVQKCLCRQRLLSFWHRERIGKNRKKKDMVFKNLQVQSRRTQTKNIYVLFIKSLKEFHENWTKCDAIFGAVNRFWWNQLFYRNTAVCFAITALRKIGENKDGPIHCPNYRKPNKGAIYRHI